MEKIKVKRKQNCLVISHKLQKQERISSAATDIIVKGEIGALRPAEVFFSLRGEELRFTFYDAVTFREYLECGLPFGLFCQLVCQIVSTVQGCESHGIRESNLEMEPEYIFCNLETESFQMIYWPLIAPVECADLRESFRNYGESYLCSEQDQPFRNRYLEYFDSRGSFDVFHFESHLKFLMSSWEDRSIERREESVHRQKTGFTPALYGASSGGRVPIVKFPFVVGRAPECCDHVIEGDPTVSRNHFVIDSQGGGVVLLDYSSNGTLINGSRVPRGVGIELNPGDRIKIGDTELIYNLK